jgi:hypothetical protein
MAARSKSLLAMLVAAPIFTLVIDAAEAQTSGARSPSAPPPPSSSGPTAGGAGGGTRAPSTTATPSTAPSSALPPTQPVPPIAPLSPQLPTQFSTGGSGQSNLALSPGSSSERPSAPGGGGETLKDCMGFWEPATHMTKAEWRAACQRTLNRLKNP